MRPRQGCRARLSSMPGAIWVRDEPGATPDTFRLAKKCDYPAQGPAGPRQYSEL